MFSGILTEIWLSSICDILTWSNKVTSSFLLSYLLPKTASVSPVWWSHGEETERSLDYSEHITYLIQYKLLMHIEWPFCFTAVFLAVSCQSGLL